MLYPVASANVGVRMYIAFSGGIDVPEINGSVSTIQKQNRWARGQTIKKAGDEFGIKPSRLKDIHVCEYGGEGHNLFNYNTYNRGESLLS